MEPVVIISIVFSIMLLLIAIGIPFIMSILDPKNIPANLANYYARKKLWGLIIALIIALVLIAVLWGVLFIWVL